VSNYQSKIKEKKAAMAIQVRLEQCPTFSVRKQNKIS